MRYELTDQEWTVIKPMLPNKPRGVARVNDRRVLDGIFWVLRFHRPTAGKPSRLDGSNEIFLHGLKRRSDAEAEQKE
jgi:transposase